MEFCEMQGLARGVRARYAQHEACQYGRSWTDEELMLGFLGDVGDLAKFVQGKAGVRPRPDLDEALARSLATWTPRRPDRHLTVAAGCVRQRSRTSSTRVNAHPAGSARRPVPRF